MARGSGVTIHLPGHPPNANQLHRMDHISRWRSRQEWKKAAWAGALEAGLGNARISPARLHVTYTFTTRRERDFDNLVAGLKGAIDGLVAAGVIPGDSLEHLRGIDLVEVIDKQAKPGIAIEVEALAERKVA